jgi:hypothetical protein
MTRRRMAGEKAGRITAQIAAMEAGFAKWGAQLSPAEVDAYTAAMERLKATQQGMTFDAQFAKLNEEVKKANGQFGPLTDSINAIGAAIQDNLTGGLTDAFMSFITGAQSAEDAMKQWALTFIQELNAIIIKALLLYAIQQALGMALGGAQSPLRLASGIGPYSAGGGGGGSDGEGGVSCLSAE